MASPTTVSSALDDEPWRVLVVASDPEATPADLLELEAQVARDSLSEGPNGVSVDTVATLHRQELVRTLRDTRPHIVHYTRRGSVERNIRMLDPRGWIRQITGRTLAGMFHEAECRIPILMLLNCSIFRERWYVSEFSEYLLTFRSEEATHQLPMSLVHGVYAAVGSRSESAGTLNRVASYAAESPAMRGIEFRSFGREERGQTSHVGLRNLEPWSPPETALDVIKSPTFARRIASRSRQPDGATGVREEARKYRVWFGTNRQGERRNGTVSFGSGRSDQVSYGYCDVTIPRYHRIGSVGDSWWKRFPRFRENNRLTVEGRQLLVQGAFYSQLRGLFGRLPDDERVLMVFLHGFNVSFDRAAMAAAQLGVDLGIAGTTAFFSWPSKGSVTKYAADVASMEASERHIAGFLLEMSERCGASRVHLIAHSMGNQGLLRAFNGLAQRTRRRIGKSLKQVFLAAPDVDGSLFRDLADVYHSMATRTTMYVSSRDLALNSSGIMHGHPRAGYTPPVTVVQGVDTVEVANIDLTYLGHGYVASARPVLVDMHSAMAQDAEPARRFGLQPALTDDGQAYWQFRP